MRNARSIFFHQRNLIFDHIRYDWSFRWPRNMKYRFALLHPPRSLPRYLSCASALTVTRPKVHSSFQQQPLENIWMFFFCNALIPKSTYWAPRSIIRKRQLTTNLENTILLFLESSLCLSFPGVKQNTDAVTKTPNICNNYFAWSGFSPIRLRDRP